jgi:hypothetical protein
MGVARGDRIRVVASVSQVERQTTGMDEQRERSCRLLLLVLSRRPAQRLGDARLRPQKEECAAVREMTAAAPELHGT